MKFKPILISACLIFLFSIAGLGCSSQKENVENVPSPPAKEAAPISIDDFSVHKIGSPEDLVAIGMGRAAVEAVVGQPVTETNNDYSISCSYPSGINMVYRSDAVADITLSADSEQVYQTHRGLSVGQDNDVQTQFSQTPEETISSSNINFIYDAELDQVVEKVPDPPEDHVFVYNIRVDVVTEKIQNIRLSDNQAFASGGQR